MRHLLRKCFNCDLYTLKQECPRCHGITHDPHPPKFSPDDRYARYRIADRYKGGEEEIGSSQREESTGDVEDVEEDRRYEDV
ncbi:MAG: RNA-protein complex protein Nop10 [Candidatus Nitrosocaldus sp.]